MAESKPLPETRESDPHFNYDGQGKSFEQESRDSADMLGLVILIGLVWFMILLGLWVFHVI